MKKIVLETVVFSMIFVRSVCATPPPMFSYQFSDTCPKDKPFVRYNESYVTTECIGCDFPETIVIRSGHEKDFEICENREIFVFSGNVAGNYKSRLKNCPNDMPLQTEAGCQSCSFQGEVYGKHLTKEMCSLCPNSFYYKRGEYGYCVHVQCPPGNPMAFRYNTCDFLEEVPDFKWVCEGCNSRYIGFLKEECDKCSNRIFIDGKCMFIDNPYVDRPVMARYIPEKIMFDGKELEGPLDCNEKVGFYSCFDETTQFITSKEECEKCPNRFFIYPNICQLKIPFYAFSEKCRNGSLFSADKLSTCLGCDERKAILIKAGHEKDFEICPNRETIYKKIQNRNISVSSLKVCPQDFPIKEEDGTCRKICPQQAPMLGKKCYPCSTIRTDIEEKECQKCSNRIFRNNQCEFKESPDPNKPFIEYRQRLNCNHKMAFFYNCNEFNHFESKQNCDKCPNREWTGQDCRLKGDNHVHLEFMECDE